MLHYTVYKTTCLCNGKIYVGVHRTENPNDDYLGSGYLLNAAVKKYGRKAFVKEVLFDFGTSEEMSEKEAEIVDPDFVDRADTYNLVPGGYQGNAYYQTTKRLSEHRRDWLKQGSDKHCLLLQEDPTYRANFSKKVGDANRRAFAEGRRDKTRLRLRKGGKIDFTVKVRAKISESNSGERNSQHGTKWVCKQGEKPLKVPGEEVSVWLGKGWHLGRSQKPRPQRTRQWVSKTGEKPRQVPLAQIPQYLESGWEKGRSQGGCLPVRI